jgi:hypothetical protein
MKQDVLKRAKSKNFQLRLSAAISVTAFSIASLFLTATLVLCQGRTNLPKDQKWFASPQEAADALISASEKNDDQSFKEILGPNSYDLIHTGEQDLDNQTIAEFASLARTKTSISYEPKNGTRAVVLIGNDSWPFAIPLSKAGLKWFFDTEAGRQEILFRRIGRNEFDAIRICRGFVEAQHQYALVKHDNSLVNQYAQRIISSPGKHDGLAWQNEDGTWGGTVGENAAAALQQFYTGKPAPFHGFYFKVLKGQGPAAPLGQLDYVVDGAMIGGFALLAFPAVYQGTGVKSFIVSQDGVVYEKDLGMDTLVKAAAIDRFNPDLSWKPVFDEK